MSFESSLSNITIHLSRHLEFFFCKPGILRPGDRERSKDQRSLANHLLLMTHPIINIQASNPELLHTVNNNQLGGGLSYV